MSFTRVIGIAIIASFVLFQLFQTGAADLNIDQFSGGWYDVGVIFPLKFKTNPIQCRWTEIESLDGNNFHENIMSISRRRGVETYEGRGVIHGSEIHIQYSPIEGGTTKYDVISYNNGNELILRDLADAENSVLLSRDASVSEETFQDFESLAADIDAFAHFIVNTECEKYM